MLISTEKVFIEYQSMPLFQGQTGSGSNDNKGVLYTPQISRTGAVTPDAL